MQKGMTSLLTLVISLPLQPCPVEKYIVSQIETVPETFHSELA